MGRSLGRPVALSVLGVELAEPLGDNLGHRHRQLWAEPDVWIVLAMLVLDAVAVIVLLAIPLEQQVVMLFLDDCADVKNRVLTFSAAFIAKMVLKGWSATLVPPI